MDRLAVSVMMTEVKSPGVSVKFHWEPGCREVMLTEENHIHI